jgi:hypothetical protein
MRERLARRRGICGMRTTMVVSLPICDTLPCLSYHLPKSARNELPASMEGYPLETAFRSCTLSNIFRTSLESDASWYEKQRPSSES